MKRPDIDTIECFFLVAFEDATTMSKAGIESVLGLVEYAKLQESRVAELEQERDRWRTRSESTLNRLQAEHAARVAELEANIATEVDLTITQQAEGIEHARAMGVLERRHRDAVEATRTAEARVRAQKSRPMSEAPRDGTDVLAFNGAFHIVSWEPPWKGYHNGRWNGLSGGVEHDSVYFPLPDQPEEKSKDA